ncbi:hypothetical protein BDA96_04G307000 [Sorghum bicolor]|uniref:Late embryogenesis abundant protein LEA-2 subgroup domain-containing protein n=2 Tax=Sorghum bicolor TaxID=4558 RepID=A0A921R8W6_SORBI|nr:uncharacterized protein LOC8073923 [Sorghum bicolor]KAG0534756.1 hypothetical protein BDA96_04G307000 [Sorghum bicolor]OQU85669.1 hypothetical protein SORBI_3004G287500 [Sorghum bicolor]|eukprot:XP_002452776.1 uncharacterized protein LOC8073923 [Sorghum bicolor]
MARHAKTDSDVTSLAASTPPRSPRGRPAYYVLSPAASHPDVHVGGVAGTTPAESPLHYHFHHHHRGSSGGVGDGGAGAGGGGMHHSRESSTGRLLFSDQLRSGGDVAAVVSVPWRRLGHGGSGAGSVGDDDGGASLTRGGFADSPWRCYALGAFAFVAVFAFFLLVLWGASRSYKPHVVVKSVVFESYHIQGGTDRTGVPTKMMSVNATVRLRFRNRGTFFSLHVTATPFLLFYGDLTVASGDMAEFYQPRKSGRMVTVSVVGKQVPLYGAGAGLHSKPNNGRLGAAVVPVELDLVLRARAHILGLLVKSKFYRRVHCRLHIHEAHLGRPARGVAAGCQYHDGLR